MRVVLGLTGASGIIYGLRLAEHFKKHGIELHTVVSEGALQVSAAECLDHEELLNFLKDVSFKVYRDYDFYSPIASSSFPIDAVVVAPCTLRTLSDIATSRQDTLVSRAAGNALRMGRKVVLLVRETPLSALDIENMLKASLAGAVIMPASPPFYGAPEDIIDLVDNICGKILDILGIENDIYARWGGKVTPETTLCGRLYGSEGS